MYLDSLKLSHDSYFFKLLYDLKFNQWPKKMTLKADYTMFLMKKEYLYTKLKYSRVPQFDIASGASAGLLAGLLGFIITEKFGFELLDSGDFYMIVMYLGLIILIFRALFTSISSVSDDLEIWNSLFNLLKFYYTLFQLLHDYLIYIKLELSLWLENKSVR